MNIGIDTHSLFASYYADRETGEYCKNLINEITSLLRQNTTSGQKEQVYLFNAYGDTPAGVSNNNATAYITRKLETTNMLHEADPFVRITAAQMQHFCIDNDIDILHFTSPYNYEAASMLKVPQKTAKVVTVYDFLPSIYPEYCLKDPHFELHYRRQRDLLSGFDAIICVSQTTAGDLIDYTRIPKEKVYVVDFGFEPVDMESTGPFDKKDFLNIGAKKRDDISWQTIAEKTLEVYKTIVRKKAEGLEAKKTQRGKKHIAWFSPLPPVKSGISGYSYEILMLLEKSVDIDIFIDEGYTPAVPELTKSKIYSHTLFKEMIEKTGYDAIVYQMGSSNYHSYIMGYIKKYSGIVVSHDSNYHPVLYHLVGGDMKSLQFREAMRLEFGIEKGDIIADEAANNINLYRELQQKYIMNDYFLGDTKKLITTNEFNKQKALEKEIGRDISVIHLHSWVPGDFFDSDKAAIKEKFGLDKNSIMIGSFGAVSPDKRNLEALKAFANIADEFENVFFCFTGGYNKVYYDELLSFLKRNRRLRDRVIFTGTVSDEEYFDWMKITDIFVGLRGHKNSNSAPLLQAFGAGLPCIISGIDIFDYVDDESVIKIRTDENEISDLEAAIGLLLGNEEKRIALGKKAKELSETVFSVAVAAGKYEKIINEFESVRDRVILRNNDIDNIISYIGELKTVDPAEYLEEQASAFSKEISMLDRVYNDMER